MCDRGETGERNRESVGEGARRSCWIEREREDAENWGRKREVQGEKLRRREMAGEERERERRERDDRTRDTDVFETSCRSSHA